MCICTILLVNVYLNIILYSLYRCQGMFHYGIMVGNGILIFLNGVGLFMQTIYVTLFIIVSRPKVCCNLICIAFKVLILLLLFYYYTVD